ncbi:MAG: hypothetical protein L0Z62_44865 [Gemmataceae bacterium]|nr:hypothetical protein [Gemmataceae bacterium]
MPSETVPHIYHHEQRVAQSLEQGIEAWLTAHAEAMAAFDVEAWLDSYLAAATLAARLPAQAKQRLRANQLPNPHGVGELLLSVLDKYLTVGRTLQAAVEEVQRKGYAVARAAELSSVQTSLQKAREMLRTRWPWIDKGRWERTAEQLARGEYQTAEEIVHELRSADPA